MPGLDCPDLDALRRHIGDCHRCPLGSLGRKQVVFGVGNPRARVMLIGEGPGKNEDLQGEPFVGAAGQFLNELLEHAGLERNEVYIANIVKCRPPGNRDPEAIEIDTCTPFLREQIRLIGPQVLVTLGNFATKWVLKTETGITRLHGTIQERGRFTVMPVYHPAAAIYDRSKRDTLLDDFARLAHVLAEKNTQAGGAWAQRVEASDVAAGEAAAEAAAEAADRAAGESPGGGPEQPRLFS
jgi:uracil-DNA glycosylase family 4